MPRDKFLQQVTDYYINRGEDLSKYVFVFPNRRSAMFARRYMQQSMHGVNMMPRMITVTKFTAYYCRSRLGTPTELIFILYDVYCEILRRRGREKQIPDFDSFYFWGSVVLNDFNDVDAYMVDPAKIFRNLKDYKEISSNYLTEDQLSVIEFLWGKNTAYSNPDVFWNHLPHDSAEGSPSDRFLNLWEIMEELYAEFVKRIDSLPTPLTYSGLQSRRACETIREMGAEDFKGKRYVFVGFNVLSTARTLIFRRLQEIGIADFFWDIASPFLVDDSGNPTKAGRFIIPLSRKFPSPEDFEPVVQQSVPEIEIVSVPSDSGQAKVANLMLKKWVDEGLDNPADMVNTSVVLADENLLTPMLHSVPEKIHPVNVTIGMSYNATPFASLMSAIISLHIRSYSIRGRMHYFYQDVTDVVSHSYITHLFPESSAAINDMISKDHLYNLDAIELAEKFPDLAFMFTVVTDPRDITQVKAYITNLVDTLSRVITDKYDDGSSRYLYEIVILDGYRTAVKDLCGLIERYKVKLVEQTFFTIIEHIMRQLKMTVVGMPLKGLQVMGVMDTRCIDFDNIIMMSVNEKVLPKRNYTPSIIPANLRAGYMLPTADHEEASYAYQFYRLLSRAKRVALLYDSRVGGMKSGEMSRYAARLLHLENSYHVKTSQYDFRSEPSQPRVIQIEKTDLVNRELREFFPGGRLSLSASALKSYLRCPLMFYLQYVKGLRIDEQVIDYIDASSYGSTLHKVAQKLYEPHQGQRVNAETIKAMLATDIERLAAETLDQGYYGTRYSGNLDLMPGEGKIVSQLIAKYIRNMLREEMAYEPFVFDGAEVGEKKVFKWQINDRYTVNFKMSIDRIDTIIPSENPARRHLRFIDYKTGKEKLSSTTIDNLFDNHENAGMFQLLLYCHAYASITGFSGRIKPVIYQFVTMGKDGISDLRLGYGAKGFTLNDYRDADQLTDSEGRTFFERFEHLIDMIFDPEKYPFTQTDNIDDCKFCPFIQICGRYPKEKFK